MSNDYRNSFEYNKWKFGVFMRDNYTCQCCGSTKKPEAHHIKNYKANEMLRLDINNGITLCRECHNMYVKNSFHDVYGTFNNDERQLKEYIQNKRTSVFNIPKSKPVEDTPIESDWVCEQKEILENNMEYILSEMFEIEYPYLSKFIENEKKTLWRLIRRCKKIIKEEIKYEDKPLFFVDSDNYIKQSLALLSSFGLIVKIDAEKLTEYQLHKARLVMVEKECNEFDYYQMPEYGMLHLESFEKMAKKLVYERRI